MKNGFIAEQIKLQKYENQSCERKMKIKKEGNHENMPSCNTEDKNTNNQTSDAKKNKFQKDKTQIINTKVIMCKSTI